VVEQRPVSTVFLSMSILLLIPSRQRLHWWDTEHCGVLDATPEPHTIEHDPIELSHEHSVLQVHRRSQLQVSICGLMFKEQRLINLSYTLLDARDMPAFLRCTLLDPNKPIQSEVGLLPVLEPIPAPSKSKLCFWLSSVLVNLICSAPPASLPKRVDQPNNFAAFVHLLIYLKNVVGIPSHWLSDFLVALLDNKWSTSAVPHHQTLPITRNPYGTANREPTKMNLDVRRADLQITVSDLRPLIPFPLPSHSPTEPTENLILGSDDIVTLRATGLAPYAGEYSRRTPQASPFTPVVSLAFFKVPESSTYERFVDQKGIFGLLTLPKAQLKDIGDIQILLSQVRAVFLPVGIWHLTLV
jgi:hypothetical protein